MEALDRLEDIVNNLLGRLDALKAENSELKAQIENLAGCKADLEAQNRLLNDALAVKEHAVNEVLARIDSLMRRIEEHDNVG